MIQFLNIIILLSFILTFLTLIAGLIVTAKSGDDSAKINKYMKYRVYFQSLAIFILIVSMLIKKQISG